MIETWSWNIPAGAPITQLGDTGISVGTDDVTKKNDYAVVGTNTITFDAALVPTNAASSFATPVSFSVKVSDPCETTNINQVAFNSMTVGNG